MSTKLASQVQDAGVEALGVLSDVPSDLVASAIVMVRGRMQAGLSAREACDRFAADIAVLLAGHLYTKELGPDGWVLHPCGQVHAMHVWAAGALLAIDTWRASGDVDDALDALHMASEAMFMHGRRGMQEHERAREAQARSERGARGGRPQKVTDDQVHEAWNEFMRRRTSDRGGVKAVAARLGMDEGTLSERLRRLGLRG